MIHVHTNQIQWCLFQLVIIIASRANNPTSLTAGVSLGPLKGPESSRGFWCPLMLSKHYFYSMHSDTKLDKTTIYSQSNFSLLSQPLNPPLQFPRKGSSFVVVCFMKISPKIPERSYFETNLQRYSDFFTKHHVWFYENIFPGEGVRWYREGA